MCCVENEKLSDDNDLLPGLYGLHCVVADEAKIDSLSFSKFPRRYRHRATAD